MAHAGAIRFSNRFLSPTARPRFRPGLQRFGRPIIALEGDMTQFEVKVSASIDYEVTVEEPASMAHIQLDRAMTTHTHVHGRLLRGCERRSARAKSRFSNALYDISAAIVVKQSPKIPEGGGGGISTAADLIGFAAAVNAGASTARWENEAGEVVLLNDIDMAAVESWTPIGGVDASEYNTTTPYKGQSIPSRAPSTVRASPSRT